MTTEYKVIDTDNRDVTTTILKVQDSDGNLYHIEVDPIELFKNAFENAGLRSFVIDAAVQDLLLLVDEVNDGDK